MVLNGPHDNLLCSYTPYTFAHKSSKNKGMMFVFNRRFSLTFSAALGNLSKLNCARLHENSRHGRVFKQAWTQLIWLNENVRFFLQKTYYRSTVSSNKGWKKHPYSLCFGDILNIFHYNLQCHAMCVVKQSLRLHLFLKGKHRAWQVLEFCRLF